MIRLTTIIATLTGCLFSMFAHADLYKYDWHVRKSYCSGSDFLQPCDLLDTSKKAFTGRKMKAERGAKKQPLEVQNSDDSVAFATIKLHGEVHCVKVIELGACTGSGCDGYENESEIFIKQLGKLPSGDLLECDGARFTPAWENLIRTTVGVCPSGDAGGWQAMN